MAEEVFGRIIRKEEADQTFGPVHFMKEIESSILTDLCSKSDRLMFEFIDGELVILGRGRVPLLPENATVDEEKVFKVYSVSVIQDLLNEGENSAVSVEQRENVLTITNDNSTLEYGSNCPPNC